MDLTPARNAVSASPTVSIQGPQTERKFIVDYKTTDSCEDGHFERSARQYGYKFQSGMYTEGVTINTGDDYDFDL